MLISAIQAQPPTNAPSGVQLNKSKSSIGMTKDLQSDSIAITKHQNVAFKGLLEDLAKVVGGGAVVLAIAAVTTPVVGAAALAVGTFKLLFDDDSGSSKKG